MHKGCMFKRYFLLIIVVFVISVAFASNSRVTNFDGQKEPAYSSVRNAVSLPESTVAQTVSDTIGIKDKLRQKSLKQIFANVLQIKEGKIGAIIQKFQSNTPYWVWMVQEGTLPKNVNAKTQLTSEGTLTILDYDKLKKATNLSVARTIIHEMVHAYLTLFYRLDPVQARVDYPDIYIKWQINKNFDYDQLQHEEIENKFLDDFTAALKEYGSDTELNISDAVYADLAWGGLDFKNSNQLTEIAKERVQDRLIAEQLNRRSGTENPAGIKITN